MSKAEKTVLTPSDGFVFLGRLWRFNKASDGRWETTDMKMNAVRVHRIGIESITSFDGITANCIVIGPLKLTWGKLNQ